MAGQRGEKMSSAVKELASEFIERESNSISLITVTNVEFQDRSNRAIIRFTVLPEKDEKSSLEFLKRKRSDFWNFVKEHGRIARIPSFDFEIDFGEKNRQKIDGLSMGQ